MFIHFEAAKRILRYLQCTEGFGIKFDKQENMKLIRFYDGDWCERIIDDMKNTYGCIFSFLKLKEATISGTILCRI